MISTPLFAAILGLILWIILSAPSPSHWIKPVLAKAAEWLFVVGALWALYPYVGKVVF